jgi:hypothetical protein
MYKNKRETAILDLKYGGISITVHNGIGTLLP